jgi:dolichol-phosphate mannosyltransferase
MDIRADARRADVTAPQPEMPPKLSIVVPVYNEAENFPTLREALSAIRAPFDVYVVYDFDEDTTVPVVQRAIQEGDSRFHLVKNSIGRGVIGALRTGFQCVTEGPVLVVMGDISDDLNVVEQMLALYAKGFDLVAASRYIPGGALIGGPFLKRNFSRWAGRSLHFLRGIPTSDATNAFKLYDACMLRAITLESRGGFELSLEITVKAFLAGYRITELPTVWRDRTAGESRFRLWHWLPRYLHWYFYAFRPRSNRVAPGTRRASLAAK